MRQKTHQKEAVHDEIARLLAIRRVLKGKKPIFLRQDAHKKKKLAKKWRVPKGLHSKMRLGKKSYCKMISEGWKSPKAVRGLSPEGLVQVRVYSPRSLNSLSKNHGIIIASGVGDRNRKAILEEADRLNLRVLNFRNVADALKRVDEKLKQRQEKKQLKVKKEEPKKPTLAEKVEAEGSAATPNEEKKKKEKKEFDRLLTKRV